MHNYHWALHTTTQPVVLSSPNEQNLCIFGFYFILLIKSLFWSQVNRTIFQSIVTISFLCIYLVNDLHIIQF